jgi:hypothetical protein
MAQSVGGMNEPEMIKELWKIANIITGFSIVQSLGFAIALGKDLESLEEQSICFKIVISILFMFSAVLYSVGVTKCYRLAMAIQAPCGDTWFQVTYCRIVCIWIYTTVPIFGLFVRNIF